MGITYKLTQEVINFILEQKKENPCFSCRKLSILLREKFQITVSKSSINSIAKSAGLSMPVGRRSKKAAKMPKIAPTEPKQEPTELLTFMPAEPLSSAIKPAEAIPPEPEPAEPVPSPPEPAEPLHSPPESAEAIPPEPEPAEPVPSPPESTEAIPPEPRPTEAIPPEPEPVEPIPAENAIYDLTSVTPISYEWKPPELTPAEAELPQERECPGAILLKAVDNLLSGSHQIMEAANKGLPQRITNILAKTEGLIYMPLFDLTKDVDIRGVSGWNSLIGKKLSHEDALSYLNLLQPVKTIHLDFSRIISHIFKEVRCIKVDLSDNNVIYLDGQLHTVWSTPHIPYDFSINAFKAIGYIKKCFENAFPLVLGLIPGYDAPSKEFFAFLSGLDSKISKITGLTVYGNEFEEIKSIPVYNSGKQRFVFGMWPWQFPEYRKVKKMGEFKPCKVKLFSQDSFAADIELELMQPQLKQSVTISGYALKTTLSEKTRLVILSNFTEEASSAEELLNLYLSHWPNLEEGFQDFSRKVELFTYTGGSRKFFSVQALNIEPDEVADAKSLFDSYLRGLDLYFKWHFLPPEYEKAAFSTINERFYCLKAQLARKEDGLRISFQPEEPHQYKIDLEYALRRLNEQEIFTADKKRLWFSV